MVKTFLVSDPHFGHKNMKKFGFRPWGVDQVEEMDQTLVDNWNSVVGPKDKVYCLGDFAIPRRKIEIAGRLNGDKVLIKGNHDIFDAADYLKHFRDLRSTHKLDIYILTHIPVHPGSIARWAGGNIHGHLHEHRVKLESGQIDPRYFCVSVEHTNYTPIDFEEVRRLIKKQQEEYDGPQLTVPWSETSARLQTTPSAG